MIECLYTVVHNKVVTCVRIGYSKSYLFVSDRMPEVPLCSPIWDVAGCQTVWVGWISLFITTRLLEIGVILLGQLVE